MKHTIHRGTQRGRTHAVARIDRRRSCPGAPGQTRADSACGRAGPRRCGGRIDGGCGNRDGVSHQTPVRRRRHGGGVERRSPRWGEAQAHRARRDVAGRGGVLGPAGRTRSLDSGTARWRDGATYRTPGAVARDGAPTLGRASRSSPGSARCGASLVSTPSTWRGWKTCSTFTANPLTRADRSFASTKLRSNSSARHELPGRRSRASPHVSTMNIGATAPRICSCSSTRHRPWRHVRVTERKTAHDFAQCMYELAQGALSRGRHDPGGAR